MPDDLGPMATPVGECDVYRMTGSKGVAGALVLMLIACGKTDEEGSELQGPPQCNVDPWQCPAGQTCWTIDDQGNFGCIPSAANAKKGDPCSPGIGQATCGDAMACLKRIGQGKGSCRAYCAPRV